MKKYIVLLRGVNVGGTGTISMAALKAELSKVGFEDVRSYINSGNILLTSDKSGTEVTSVIASILAKKFKLDEVINKVLVLTPAKLAAVIKNKPKGFGDDKQKYYSDAIFLIGTTTKKVMPVFNPKDGVDRIWPGAGVVYSQRLGSMRTKSRLGKIVSSPLYKSMTIRSWGTVTKLLALVQQ